MEQISQKTGAGALQKMFGPIFYLAVAGLLTVILFWGGSLFLPLAVVVLGPLFLILMNPLEEPESFKKEEGMEYWSKIPQRAKLEKEIEQEGLPVLITHRDSTAIVYANETAKIWLGEGLVGRTMDSESLLPFKPILVNGYRVGRKNHPAALVQEGEQRHVDILWATPRGDISFCFEGRSLPIGSLRAGEYFKLTLHPKVSNGACA